MSKRSFALAPVFACSVILTSGAWSSKESTAPPPQEASPASQPLELDPAPASFDAASLLQKAMAVLDPSAHPWLRVKLWQKWADRNVSLEAEGQLQRGPRLCARLEWTFRNRPGVTQLLVVSDGSALAHVWTESPGLPKATSKLLVPPGSPPESAAAVAEQQLENHGCGGPFAAL